VGGKDVGIVGGDIEVRRQLILLSNYQMKGQNKQNLYFDNYCMQTIPPTLKSILKCIQ